MSHGMSHGRVIKGPLNFRGEQSFHSGAAESQKVVPHSSAFPANRVITLVAFDHSVVKVEGCRSKSKEHRNRKGWQDSGSPASHSGGGRRGLECVRQPGKWGKHITIWQRNTGNRRIYKQVNLTEITYGWNKWMNERMGKKHKYRARNRNTKTENSTDYDTLFSFN